MSKVSKVGVIGAGAWGTAMATALSRGGHDVLLWARENEVTDCINTNHENKRYLPGYPLSPTLRASTSIEEVADSKDFLFVASPSLYLASTISQITNIPSIENGDTIIAALTKGFVPDKNSELPLLVLQVIESVLPEFYKGSTVYVSGPSHAEEVAMGKLTGLIAASENPKSSIKVRDLLRVRGIMAYSSFDVVGVQLCAAAKNVIAVVYGALDEVSKTSDFLGDNAQSLLMAAGLNEIQTLGMAMGATHPETFTSISGVGDLDVTCKSKYGRNRRFGQDIIQKNILSQFKDIDDIIANISKIGYLPEGAIACKYVHAISEKKGIKLPICDCLYRILNKETSPMEYLKELLSSS